MKGKLLETLVASAAGGDVLLDGLEKRTLAWGEGREVVRVLGEPEVPEGKEVQLTWLDVDESWHVGEVVESDDGLPWRSSLQEGGEGSGSHAALLRRTTILPRAQVEGRRAKLVHKDADRYETLEPLGEGGAGEVFLARDNDIHRLVAVKRLRDQQHVPISMLRFAEEIRTTGRLEHPNIVPIHDVGLDESGKFYYVMKYVSGETMEQVIERLQAGDPEAHAQYPFEVRNQIFMKVLDAMEFAHEQGIIHRDLKPANIMIGEHGEVMVMDWGLAKQVRIAESPDAKAASFGTLDDEGEGTGNNPRFETQHHALLGTPAYMSPEQAMGQNKTLDERSDIYSLSVLYYEWMGLKHYMAHKEKLQDLLFGIVQEKPTLLAMVKSPHQTPVPVEFCHFVRHGMTKRPEERYTSVAEMKKSLQLATSGRFAVECPITFTKRATNEVLRFTDRFPFLTFGSMIFGAGLLLFGAGHALWSLGQLLLG